MILRDYQQDLLDAARQAYARHRRVLLPTAARSRRLGAAAFRP